MKLNRDAFLKPAKIPQETVELPELGGSVIVRGMTARQRSEFERQFQSPSGKPSKQRQAEVRERLLIACVVDDAGQPLFSQSDIEAIGQQSAQVIERIVDVAQRLCGMSSGDVEDLAKNSSETAGGG